MTAKTARARIPTRRFVSAPRCATVLPLREPTTTTAPVAPSPLPSWVPAVTVAAVVATVPQAVPCVPDVVCEDAAVVVMPDAWHYRIVKDGNLYHVWHVAVAVGMQYLNSATSPLTTDAQATRLASAHYRHCHNLASHTHLTLTITDKRDDNRACSIRLEVADE